jgi:hypothetical protein
MNAACFLVLLVKKFRKLSLILHLLSSTKVRQFFGSNRNSKDISLENKEKNMCLAAVKFTMKGIAACLGF